MKDFAKYFDFVIEKTDKENQPSGGHNEATMIIADSSVDASDLSKIFKGSNLDSKHLRETLWKRKK